MTQFTDAVKPVQTKRRGFTLIELLVVIGIIALLAAIIFPVFSTVRENNRANVSISNLHDISTKLELYRLDHQAYPPVLFGYQFGGAPMDQAYDLANAASTCGFGNSQPCAPYYFPGLYPEYINNINEFRDPNDSATLTQTVDLNPGGAKYAPTTALCAGTNDDDTACGAQGALVIANRVTKSGITLPMALYQADAYDSSPQVTDLSTIDSDQTVHPFVVRYSTSYTAITGSGNPPVNIAPIAPETASSLYTRQLRWLQPPGTSYVTCTTWHVHQSNKVLMLLQDGSVKKVDTTVFLKGGADGPLAVATDTNGDNTVTTPFWKLNP